MTLQNKDRGIIGDISYETLMYDPTLSLPVNTETTQKLLHILITELHRMRLDIQELQSSLVSPSLEVSPLG